MSAPPASNLLTVPVIATDSASKVNLSSKDKKKSTTKIYQSNSSLNAKRAQLVRTARPVNYSMATQAGVDEIIRLTKVMDDQRALIQRYADEIKTLKIINQRQDKAIKQMDKDHGGIPKLIHTMNEELRIAKIEKAKLHEKLMTSEKAYQRQSDQINKLRNQIKEMGGKLKTKETEDLLKLKDDNTKFKREITDLANKLEDVSRRFKLLEGERERESRTSRAAAARHAQHIETLQTEINKLTQKIHEKDRQISTMSIYSTHAAERKQLRSRTAEDQKGRKTPDAAKDEAHLKKNVSFNMNNNTELEISGINATSSESHPYTDAIMQSLMAKSTSTEPKGSTIHKPNFEVSKSTLGSESKHESMEDILARRMREQMLANNAGQSSLP